MDLGRQIKKLRTDKKMTLRELSKKSNLSIGFLSQLERGLSSVAIDSLQKISEALGTDLGHFLNIQKPSNANTIIHNYERNVSFVETDKFLHYYLSNDLPAYNMFPEIVDLLPGLEKGAPYTHFGEEFIYVLEGILNLDYDDNNYNLYPGDSILFCSSKPHNWHNLTNLITKILVVHYPNAFKEA